MKVKACPSIDTVRSILQERITDTRKLLDDDNTELAKLTGANQVVYNPYHDSNVAKLRSGITARTEYLKLRESEMAILESHVAPKVLVEIDV